MAITQVAKQLAGHSPRWLSRWLAMWGFSLFIVIGLLFYLVIDQRQLMKVDEAARENLLSGDAQKIDREFIRLRHEMYQQLLDKDAPALASLQEHNKQLSQIIGGLRTAPGVAQALKTPSLEMSVQRIQSLQVHLGQWIANGVRNPNDLHGLLSIADNLMPEVFTISRIVNTVQNRQWDEHHQRLATNNTWILMTFIAAIVLLVLTIVSLLLQNRERAREQERSLELTEYFRESQIKAETASRGKSRYLANMSHELRTPFNGILGMLSLLGTTRLSKQQSDYLRTANASANHLLNVLNDILDLSALEEGKFSLHTAPVELAPIVREVSDLMRPQAEQKLLRYGVEISPEVPPWLLLDGQRLKQILFNLVNNAVKFTSVGSIQIKVHKRVTTSKRDNHTVTLSFEVQDTGIGINSSAMESLFQRFNQVHHGLNKDYGGTGLGLEISQSLARLMGGEIEVKSTLGVGSTFTLTLDVSVCKAPQSLAERKVFLPDPPTKPEYVYRVLVVEDNQVNRKFVDILLKRMGYLTYFAENGQIALDRVQKEAFDLVLMDLHMPVMNGVDATRAIRALKHPAAKLPIIAITADVMNDTHDEAMAAGVNDFVTKPVHLARLQEAIRQQLEPAPAQKTEPQT
jgi:signal transduction histidine kinase/ActR/RegA family two-component response regulator